MTGKVINSRRNFIKAGVGIATSFASLGAAARLASGPSDKLFKSPEITLENGTAAWVGAGYLMARPATKDQTA